MRSLRPEWDAMRKNKLAGIISLFAMAGCLGAESAGADQLADLTAWYTAMDGSKGTVDLFPDGISFLRGDHAALTGGLVKTYIDGSHKHKGDYIDGWKSANDKLTWKATAKAADEFLVSALINGTNGATLKVQAGTASLSFTLTSGGWNKVDLGRIALPAGASNFTLSATAPGAFSMQLKSLELTPASAQAAIAAEIATTKSKADWMKRSPVGMMYQWGSWGGNPDGTASAWPGGYAKMDWGAFAQKVKDEGADFLVWSVSWTQYYVAAPITSVNAVLAGRTSKTDYLDTVLTECHKRGIKVIFYYHLGHDNNPNLDWWNAFWDAPAAGDYARKEAPINRWMNIISEIGTRYGDRLDGWLFDDGCTYYPSPFDKLTAAARAGYPDRMVSFNPWILPRYTDYEDFAFGEGYAGNAKNISNGIYTSGKQKGEQAFGNFLTEDGDWGIRKGDKDAIKTNLSQAEFTTRASNAAATQSALAFNFRMWENGTQSQTSLDYFKAAATKAHAMVALDPGATDRRADRAIRPLDMPLILNWSESVEYGKSGFDMRGRQLQNAAILRIPKDGSRLSPLPDQ
jgi:hypothetical protein